MQMVPRLACGLAAAFFAVLPAAASAIDCADKAPLTVAICASDRAKSADAVLNDAYKRIMERLADDKAATAAMRASQRAWLEWLPRSCSRDAAPPAAGFDGDQRECLADRIERRAARLEAAGRLDAPVWLADRYDARPLDPADEVPDHWYIPQTDEASVMQLVGEPELNEWLRSRVGLAKEFADDVSPGEWSVVVDLDRVGTERIEGTVTSFVFPAGAAHPSSFMEALHWLRRPGRPMEAADLMKAGGWCPKLVALAAEAVKEQHEIDADIFEPPTDAICDPSRWILTPEALTIRFQQYEIGPYALGMPEIPLPWSDLAPLTEGADRAALALD